MNALKGASLVCAALAVVLFIGATGGFSVAELDRSADIEVVDDDEAYVGYDTPDEIVVAGNTDSKNIQLLTVTNRITEDLKIENVEISEPNGIEISEDFNDAIAPGDTQSIEATISTDGSVEGELIVDVEVKATGFEAAIDGDTIERRIPVTSADGATVEFTSRGNAELVSENKKDDAKI